MKVEVANFWIGISFPELGMRGNEEEQEAQQVQVLQGIQEAKRWFHEFCLTHRMFPEVMQPGPQPFAPERSRHPIAVVFHGFRSLEVEFPLQVLQDTEQALEESGADWRIACSEMEVEPGGVWELQGDWTYDAVIADMRQASSSPT